MVRNIAAGLALGLSLSACSAGGGSSASPASAQTPSPSESASISANATSGAFTLTLTAPRTTWSANEPIQVSATLAYAGEQASIGLTGSGSGLVAFGVKELTGRLEIEGVQTADCRPYTLERATPLTVKFIKSGGFSEEDPDRDWKRQFIEDPLLRLPAGRWRVDAYSNFFEGTCAHDAPMHEIHVSLDLTVT